MRKIPYLVTLIPVLFSLILSILSFEIPDWVYSEHPSHLPLTETIRWGLSQRCERILVEFPDGTYQSESHCRDFPSKKYDDCTTESDDYCILWSTASYASELSLIFVGAAVVVLLVVTTGFGTRARRRTAWQGVVALLGLHGALQITTMAIVVHLHRTSVKPVFGAGKLSTSFYLGMTSWVLDVFVIVALVYTAFAAKSGERWAAGRRPYTPYKHLPHSSWGHTRRTSFQSRFLRRVIEKYLALLSQLPLTLPFSLPPLSKKYFSGFAGSFNLCIARFMIRPYKFLRSSESSLTLVGPSRRRFKRETIARKLETVSSKKRRDIHIKGGIKKNVVKAIGKVKRTQHNQTPNPV